MTGSVWKIVAHIMLVMDIPKLSNPITLPLGKVDRRLGRNKEKEEKKEKERRSENNKKSRGSISPGTAWAEKLKALALRASRLARIFGAVCPYIRHKQRKIFLYKKLLGMDCVFSVVRCTRVLAVQPYHKLKFGLSDNLEMIGRAMGNKTYFIRDGLSIKLGQSKLNFLLF